MKNISKQYNSVNCLVCGIKNPFGLNTRFYELGSGEVAAVFTVMPEHQSYPGRLHGGIAAAILDETIGRAVICESPELWGVTVELSIKYRKPLPDSGVLYAKGRITEENNRFFSGTGEIYLETGETAVTASGRYMKLPLEKIADTDFLDQWFPVDDPPGTPPLPDFLLAPRET